MPNKKEYTEQCETNSNKKKPVKNIKLNFKNIDSLKEEGEALKSYIEKKIDYFHRYKIYVDIKLLKKF